MSRSSEDVLQIINNVKHKKTEGVLYMMGERMAWMPGAKETFTISHMYADIKLQKISPDTKEKVQLQVVFHDSGANTFQFTNSQGREAQMKDREIVKELLQQLLPKFRRKINSELEEKNRRLQEDPDLFQLYKDLVVSQVITPDEFWTNMASKPKNNLRSSQEVGVSAAFLADIKPQTDGCNGLKYNLTTDIIESIFRTYPAVQKKHAECVPHKMTESDFWTRFFQSHYFHRDRINVGTKDVFGECAKHDEQELQKELTHQVTDDFLDIGKLSDNTVDEGYGIGLDNKKQTTNIANLSMIRRFNYHSTMVLKSCDTRTEAAMSTSEQTTTGAGVPNGTNKPAASNGKESSSEPPPQKKAKIWEKIEYEDLEQPSSSKCQTLKLTNRERYLHGPTQVTATQYHTSQDITHAAQKLQQEVHTWSPQLTQVLPSKMAVSVLGELSPGGTLMHGTNQQQLHQMVPQDVQQELKQMYSALCELLRHFWACFPASNPSLEEKVMKMKTTIERFHMAKLHPLKEKLDSYHYSVNLLGHMETMINTAYTKFTSWQARRMNKR